MEVGAGGEVEEEPERGRRGALSARIGAVHVEDRERRTRLQRSAHAPQHGDGLLGREVVDDVEQQRAVVGPAELGLEHVAVAVDDLVAHPRARR